MVTPKICIGQMVKNDSGASNDLETAKEEILEAAKTWFRDTMAPNHVKNTKKLAKPGDFNVNPFLIAYLARFLTGKNDAESIAKALIYPRVLGTSINTSFGTNLQKFIPYLKEALGNEAAGSTTSGIDIEFIDQVDGFKKYCQIKAGPNTINKDDVETIHNHFDAVKKLARTNSVKIGLNDLVVGVLYGERRELSAHYKALEKKHNYTVMIGQEFWERLTGDADFYFKLGQALASVAIEFDGTELLNETIKKLSSTEIVKKLASD